MARKSCSPEASIVSARLLADLDEKQAIYQRLHRFYHGCEDQQAKHVHEMLVSLCREFVHKMESERKR